MLIRASFPDQLSAGQLLSNCSESAQGRGYRVAVLRPSKGSGAAEAPGAAVEPIEHGQALVSHMGDDQRETLTGAR